MCGSRREAFRRKAARQLLARFPIDPAEHRFRGQLAQGDIGLVAAGKRMIGIHDEFYTLLEERPGVQPIPGLPQRTGDGQLDLTVLEGIDDSGRRTSVDLEMNSRVGAEKLRERRNQQRDVDTVGDGDVERRHVAALHRLGQRLCRRGGIVALLQQRQHAPAKFGQVRVLALTAKEFSAQLLLERLDRARQRRLRDVALFGCPGEIKRIGQGQKIADLLHLHEFSPPQRNPIRQA